MPDGAGWRGGAAPRPPPSAPRRSAWCASPRLWAGSADDVFRFAISALGLLYYPAYVWIWFNAGAPELRGHLFLAWFLTFPIVIYLALALGRATLKAVASVVSSRLA